MMQTFIKYYDVKLNNRIVMSSLANEEVLKHIARCTFCFVNNNMSVPGVPRTQLSKIEIKFTYVYSLLQSLIDICMYSFPVSITCH